MSQEYTPVDWVDETTSQQGTLINAERLDQMQTAHHYADGFEEVDEIPTEDPGTAYHKIVYCTADSAFYRWDGTQWTADIDEETKQLLDQEIARATAAESELAQDIEDEATARANADTALGARIDTEEEAREDADTQLASDITSEANARASADTALGERITQETTARESADTTLQGNITSEASAREAADTSLGASIDAETAARVSAIAALQAGVYTKAEADNLLAGKADKATTLAGYGITDAVNTSGNQTVGGIKTLTSPINVENGAATQYALKMKLTGVATKETTPSVTALNAIDWNAINGDEIGALFMRFNANGTRELDCNMIKTDGTRVSRSLVTIDSTGEYMTGPSRAYDPAHTTDVVNIATLDAYPPMVRTTGNQDIAGIKTFTDPPAGHRTNSRTNANSGYYTLMKLRLRGDGTNNQVLGGLISQYFGIIQISEPSATSISVTDIIGTFSQLLDFALYTDGSYYYVAVKQKTNNTFAYELALMSADKGNYVLNSGDIEVYFTLTAVDTSWTLVASTES